MIEFFFADGENSNNDSPAEKSKCQKWQADFLRARGAEKRSSKI